MKRLLLALALIFAALPAEAHRLKLFATVVDGTMSGYGFFVGGGRAGNVDLVVKDAAGAEVARLKTDDTGSFSYRPASPGAYRLALDAGDGHESEVAIDADRFAAGETPAAAPVQTPIAPEVAAPAPPSPPPPPALDAADLARLVAAEVDKAAERAVARQIRPLLEAYDAAEARIRINDILGGLGWIMGLVGISAWILARRRPPGGDAS
jgi:nickel transport protein